MIQTKGEKMISDKMAEERFCKDFERVGMRCCGAE